MNKKVEVLIIEDDVNVVHRTISTVYEDSNTFNVAIQAIVEALTGTKPTTKVKAGAVPLGKPVGGKDKFAEAVPDYKPPVEDKPIYHPDLIKEGVVPKPIIKEGDIPVVKISMKEVIAKGTK